MADRNEAFKLLAERQQQPMNTEADMPDVEGLDISGQSIFIGAALEEIDAREKALKEGAADSDRESAGGGNNKSAELAQQNSAPSTAAAAKLDEVVKDMDLLSLLNMFAGLQEERVKSYAVYNKTFKALAERGSAGLSQYPELCAEMTSRFAAISKQILSIKGALGNKEKHGSQGDEVVALVNKVQLQEKEKLHVVAASHLDVVKSVTGLLSPSGMEHVSQPDYLEKKVLEIESSVSSFMEEIQALKCDLL